MGLKNLVKRWLEIDEQPVEVKVHVAAPVVDDADVADAVAIASIISAPVAPVKSAPKKREPIGPAKVVDPTDINALLGSMRT